MLPAVRAVRERLFVVMTVVGLTPLALERSAIGPGPGADARGRVIARGVIERRSPCAQSATASAG